MENKKKIYIVTTRCYSDYKIRAVCTTRDKAEYIVSTCFKTDDADIEEWEVDPNVITPQPGYQHYYVTIRRNGDVVRIITNKDTNSRLSYLSHVIDFWGDDKGRLTSEILAQSEEHAIKIANEQRLAIIAAGLWKIGTREEELSSLFGRSNQ